MVAGVVLVQIIKWEETMLCDMLNNEQLLYGYVILSSRNIPRATKGGFSMFVCIAFVFLWLPALCLFK